MWILFLALAVVVGAYMIWYILQGDDKSDHTCVGFRHVTGYLEYVPAEFLELMEKDFAIQKDIEGTIYMMLNQYMDRQFCKSHGLKKRRTMVKYLQAAYNHLKNSRFRDYETALNYIGNGTSDEITRTYAAVIDEMIQQRYGLPKFED